MSEILRSLLIVEDEVDVRDILTDLIKDITPHLYVVSNGQEALTLFKANPDITAILSDINMPNMNGLDLLRKLREEGHETPFVILTSYGDRSSLQEALRLGATDFIDKPFHFEQLLESVTRALDLGLALKEVTREVDALYETVQVSPEKLMALKKAKRSVAMLRRDQAIYTKKVA